MCFSYRDLCRYSKKLVIEGSNKESRKLIFTDNRVPECLKTWNWTVYQFIRLHLVQEMVKDHHIPQAMIALALHSMFEDLALYHQEHGHSTSSEKKLTPEASDKIPVLFLGQEGENKNTFHVAIPGYDISGVVKLNAWRENDPNVPNRFFLNAKY